MTSELMSNEQDAKDQEMQGSAQVNIQGNSDTPHNSDRAEPNNPLVNKSDALEPTPPPSELTPEEDAEVPFSAIPILTTKSSSQSSSQDQPLSTSEQEPTQNEAQEEHEQQEPHDEQPTHRQEIPEFGNAQTVGSLFNSSSNEVPENENLHTGPAFIDFDLLDTDGRWLVKVVAGPNSGAEFALQSGTSYLLGSDSIACDIILQDMSVSRQHARLTIDNLDVATIEDLGSRNGTFLDGEKCVGKKQLTGSVLLTLGTTSLIIVDKQGERKTVVTPLTAPSTQPQRDELESEIKREGTTQQPSSELPLTPSTAAQISPVAPTPSVSPSQGQAPLGDISQAVFAPLQQQVDKIKDEEKQKAKAAHALSSLVILAVITGLILAIGIGTTLLFQEEEISRPTTSNPELAISKALEEMPSVRYNYNPSNNRLVVVGHVLTSVDRSKLLDNLQQLKFLAGIDVSNVVIDEFVWRETNQVLAKNPAWRGITITAPSAGKFVVSGFLRTREQADELYDYLSQNFIYMDLLEKRVIVEEELLSQVTRDLDAAGFKTIRPSISNGVVSLKGTVGSGKAATLDALVATLRSIPGVRDIQMNIVQTAQPDEYVNITSKYPVSGSSKKRDTLFVVIGGKILTKGDTIDGMIITDVTPQAILLEKDGVKYKIDFNL